MSMGSPKRLSLQEAAEFLRMSPRTVRQWAVQGLLPGAKPAKHWIFFEIDLVAWLRAQYRCTGPAVEQEELCVSTKGQTAPAGGSNGESQTAKLYANLLTLKPKARRGLGSRSTSVDV